MHILAFKTGVDKRFLLVAVGTGSKPDKESPESIIWDIQNGRKSIGYISLVNDMDSTDENIKTLILEFLPVLSVDSLNIFDRDKRGERYLRCLLSKIGSENERINFIEDVIRRTAMHGSDTKASLMDGCHVLFGVAGSGKTTFVTSLSDSLTKHQIGFMTFSVSEPEANTLPMSNGLIALFLSIIASKDVVLMIDSLRGLIYSGSGNAIQGGISSSIMDTIAAISALSDWCGVSTIAVANPVAAKEENMKDLVVGIQASSTSAILLGVQDFTNAEISSRHNDSRAWQTDTRLNVITRLMSSISDSALNDKESAAVTTNGIGITAESPSIVNITGGSIDAMTSHAATGSEGIPTGLPVYRFS